MTARRAMLKEADLRRMARVAREERVEFRCRIDPLGNLSFQLVPELDKFTQKDDDLDSRIDDYGSL